MEPIAIESVDYGNSELLTRPITARDLSSLIAPLQTVNITMPDERFNELVRALPEIGYSHGGERVDLRIDRLIFVDGTMWHAGSELQQDIQNPSRWVNQEFQS